MCKRAIRGLFWTIILFRYFGYFDLVEVDTELNWYSNYLVLFKALNGAFIDPIRKSVYWDPSRLMTFCGLHI